MAATSSSLEVERERIREIFQFLREFNRQKFPPTRDVNTYEKTWWWEELPESPYIAKRAYFDPEADNDALGSEDDSSDHLLKITRPTLAVCPPPPAELRKWLIPGWEDPSRQAVWYEEIHDSSQGSIELTEEQELALLGWLEERDAWAEIAAQDYAALRLFNELWDVYSRLQREGESYELVLGDGQLFWNATTGLVRHPLITRSLQLDFDPGLPAFMLTEGSSDPELAASLLLSLDVHGQSLQPFIDEVRTSFIEPLSTRLLSDFLARVAGTIHRQAEYINFAKPPREAPNPVVYRNPTISLRKRTMGYDRALQFALEDLESKGGFPDALAALVGVEPPKGSDSALSDPYLQGDEAEDIFLTKEANREQLEIARRLERYGAVLVQGPPGTGKTHTIANLIGHLLAEGKSVLVTSQTAKALRVVREKVVEDLRPLCVSILEGDAASNAQLAEAAQAIGARLSSTSVDQMDREAALLQQERKDILRNIAEQRSQLLKIVLSEYEPVICGGMPVHPSEAAKQVADGAGQLDWIPGRIEPLDRAPLTQSEVIELYRLNAGLDSGDERYITDGLPDIARLPSPADFRAAVERASESQTRVELFRDVWTGGWPDGSATSFSELDRYSLEFRRFLSSDIRELLPEGAQWELELLVASVTGGPDLAPWQALCEALEAAADAQRERRLAVANLGAQLELDNPTKMFALLEQMKNHVLAGGSFGALTRFRHKEWGALLSKARIDGREPSTKEDFEVLQSLPRAAVVWRDAQTRAGRLLGADIAGSLGSRETADESACIRQADYVAAMLSVGQRLRQLLDNPPSGLLMERLLGMRLPPRTPRDWVLFEEAINAKLYAALDSEKARIHRDELEQLVGRTSRYVTTFTGHGDSQTPVGRLALGIKELDPDHYLRGYEELHRLRERESSMARRDELLSVLDDAAPAWASAIRGRAGVHGASVPPGELHSAWEWRILMQVLQESFSTPMEPMIKRIGELKGRLKRVTSDIIDRKAWAAQSRKTTHAAKMALQGYVQAIKRIGKGTGKRAPQLRRLAREQMLSARDAVPVWIAPLARVAESFDPRHTKFDVVIIDEASQLDSMGLLAWYMADQVVVVGDDEQVTPDPVGQDVLKMHNLINTFLPNVPQRMLFDEKMSIYDHAKRAFAGVVRLREHFRSVPEIIAYSNAYSYHGEIRPLRASSSARVVPAVVPHFVEGAYRDGMVNEAEAAHVVSLIAAAIEQPEYEGMTMGVISLLGNYQAPRIEQLMRSVISPEEIETRQIICGTPPNFQGDERDVIFLSLVEDPPAFPPLRRLGDPDDRTKKRYNVAVSRARDQVWLVHSIRREVDLQSDDLRRRLLDFFYDPAGLVRQLTSGSESTESEFERLVLARLQAAGYQCQPQYPVGGFRIDIVIGDERGRIALECDGARYHSGEEEIRRDMDRQAILERLGWQFYRLRSTEFFMNPEKAMSKLCERLAGAGVEPVIRSTAVELVLDTDALQDRVRARASELRAGWRERDVGLSLFAASA